MRGTCWLRLATKALWCCRWVYRRLMGLGGAEETRLTTVLEAGIREVDGGQWHYRDLQDASRDTDLSQGFR